MSKLIPFAFESHDIAVHVDETGEPWFSLPAICRVTGHSNPSMASQRIPADEKAALNIADPTGRLQPTTFVNEAGIYRLILSSRLPAAKRFKSWVVKEVLPAIRRTGSYRQPAPALNMRDLSQVQRAALQLIEINQELRDQLAEAVTQIEADKPKVQFFNAYIDSDGLYGLQNAGRALSQPPNRFVKFLRDGGYLFEQGGVLVPYQTWVTRGYFKITARNVDGKSRTQTFVTPRGMAHLGEVLNPQSTLPFLDKPKGAA